MADRTELWHILSDSNRDDRQAAADRAWTQRREALKAYTEGRDVPSVRRTPQQRGAINKLIDSCAIGIFRLIGVAAIGIFLYSLGPVSPAALNGLLVLLLLALLIKR